MTNSTEYTFGDDTPKTDPAKHDKLGYAPVAKRIADIVQKIEAPQGYVIGIHGKWGSGKSTLLNFIVKYLSDKEDPPTHIEFQPWIISGHQDLISTFFKIISETLDTDKSLCGRIRKRILRIFRGTTDNIVDTAATIAVSIDPSSTPVVRFANGALKASVRNLVDSFTEEPSLQQSYDRLHELLQRTNRRFIVTIDDIDRLTDPEIGSIMQMIKSIGRLPNVVYLLFYDRQIVWTALRNRTTSTAPGFSEKIVQQELALPKPARGALLAMLDQETSFLIAPTEASSRWSYIVRSGVHRWIQTPRDVIRLSNAVKFSWPTLQGEVDAQDLLAMEGLRLFDGNTYQWIREHRDFLFNDGQYSFAREEKRKEAVDSLTATIEEQNRLAVLELLSTLFPQIGKLLDTDASFLMEDFDGIMRRRGIACQAGYDAYFELQPSAESIPSSVIHEIAAEAHDSNAIASILRGYVPQRNQQGELMISKVLEELRLHYSGPTQEVPSPHILHAIFSVGEEIISIEDDSEMFEFSPSARLTFFLHTVLERWGPDQSKEYLVEIFSEAKSPAFVASVYVELGRELGIFVSEVNRQAHITSESFDELGKIVLRKIETAKETGTLQLAPFYFDIIRAWGHLVDSGAPKEWLRENISSSPAFMAKACIGLVSYTIGTGARRYTLRSMVDTKLYDPEALLSAGRRHLLDNSLHEDQRNLITAVVDGLEKFSPSSS